MMKTIFKDSYCSWATILRGMSVVNILNIQVLDNPTKFLNPFQFEITFECISPLKEGKIS
jgi:hypothetical protein